MTSKATFARVARADGRRVELTFDVDPDRWGFLCLPPQHPSLLEKYQFYGTVAALEVMQMLPPGVRTALTRFEWRCPPLPPEAGYGARAVCEGIETDTAKIFTFDLDTADGHRVVECRGAGVIFSDRDFAGWRAHAKAKAHATFAAQGEPPPDRFAAEAAVCVLAGAPSYVTPLDTETRTVTAFVPAATSFMPHHPFHVGSGDHVNAGQLFDCALQAAHLALQATAPRACVAGEARFSRYVELDIPFTIGVSVPTETTAGETQLTFTFSQLGRDNGRLTLHLR